MSDSTAGDEQVVPDGEGTHGSAEDRIMHDRREKLERLRSQGIDPYPNSFAVTADAAHVRAAHGGLQPGDETDARYSLAGRMMTRRGHGKAVFADLYERSGRLQLHVTLDRLGEQAFAAFGDLDLGDWIGVTGTAMCTRRGELSLAVESFELLAKCIRPLPEKWHGLTDVETRLARRYLDLVVNADSFDTFVARSRAVSAIRRFLEDRGYLEVETPVLQPMYGGAAARPFVTHHNELDQQLYLRIATELYLKRLIVGGMQKVFEIGKNFRNEGVSFKHNPEFTMIELYEAYADYDDIMELCEQMVVDAAVTVNGTTDVRVPGDVGDSGSDDDAANVVSLAAPWRRVTLRDAIREHAGIDVLESSETELRNRLEEDGFDTTADRTWAQLVDHLLSKFVEPKLIQPTFLTDYPIELSPFAKRRSDDPRLVERFECFVAGMELANAFSELNDPADQHARFMQQQAARSEGDETAEQLDDDYIRALEYGMPPTGGLGMGIDRLAMLLCGKRSIRDVILFPARRSHG